MSERVEDFDPTLLSAKEWEVLAKYQIGEAWVFDQMAKSEDPGDHDWRGFAEHARQSARLYKSFAAQAEERQAEWERDNPQ